MAISLSKKLLLWIKSHITYYTVHFTYIVLLCVVGGLILWGIENTDLKTPTLPFLDAWYMTTSAVCSTGFLAADFSKFSFASKFVILLWMIFGGVVFGTIPVLLVRRHYFHIAFREHVLDSAVQKRLNMALRGSTASLTDLGSHVNLLEAGQAERPEPKSKPEWTTEMDVELRRIKESTMEYLALGKLTKVVALYFVLMHASLTCILWAYGALHAPTRQLLDSMQISPFFFGLFHVVSAFDNVGYTLFPDNLMQFAQDRCVLLVLFFCLILGSTAYPMVLRGVIRVCHWSAKNRPRDQRVWEEILNDPRKVYTHLFPAEQNKSLLLTFTALLACQVLIFMTLEYNEPLGSPDFSLADKLLIGVFQAGSTRTAGFNAIDLSLQAAGVQVADIAFMYIACYPFILTFAQSSRTGDRNEPQESKAAHSANQKLVTDEHNWVDVDAVVLPPSTPVWKRKSRGRTSIELQSLRSLDFDSAEAQPEREEQQSREHHLPPMSPSLDGIRHSVDLFLDRTWGAASLPPNASPKRAHLKDQPRPSMGSEASNEEAEPKEDSWTATAPRPPLSPMRVVVDLPFSPSEQAVQLNTDSVPTTRPRRRSSSVHKKRLSIDTRDQQTQPSAARPAPEQATIAAAPEQWTITAHVQSLLLRDSFWLFVAMFGITASQTDRFRTDPGFTIFKVIYEVVSGYANVGLTLGYPNSVLSFGGVCNDFSKFLMILIQIVGRHRGLPSSLDPAVLPPRSPRSSFAKIGEQAPYFNKKFSFFNSSPNPQGVTVVVEASSSQSPRSQRPPVTVTATSVYHHIRRGKSKHHHHRHRSNNKGLPSVPSAGWADCSSRSVTPSPLPLRSDEPKTSMDELSIDLGGLSEHLEPQKFV